MKTVIISAFPGMGKTYYYNNANGVAVSDSDSSKFSWIYNEDGTKERNPEFPKNYIEHIKDLVGKVDFIFVSTHEEVRNALIENCIPFILTFPFAGLKDGYMSRYKDRESDEKFISLLDENFEKWCDDLLDWSHKNLQNPKFRYLPILKDNYYIRDIINHEDFKNYADVVGIESIDTDIKYTNKKEDIEEDAIIYTTKCGCDS